MPDVFLSYCREDQVAARLFVAGLEQEGFSVWWDQALHAGEAFDRVTERALEQARAVVVLWSRRSVESDWVRAEAAQAHASRRMVPAMIEPCKRPVMYELTHTADLSNWKGDRADPRWRSFAAALRRFTSTNPASPTSPAAAVGPQIPGWRRRALVLGAAALVTVAAAGVAWHLQASRQRVLDASIAVLPFEDMSAGKDQDYFASGVSEQILDTLARVGDPNLKVIARTSSFAFKGRNQDVREIGRSLGVAHVLEGSVRKAGQQLRVTAQLIRTDTGAHIWSKQYERPAADVFAVQDDVARAVAESLQVSLGVGDIGQRPGMTRDADAYDDYLAGIYLGNAYSADSQRLAVETLQRAVARDAGFALAWVALSRAYGGMPALTSGNDAAGWNQKAAEAFARFEELLPGSTEAHLQRAFREMQRGRFLETGRHFKDAVRLSPGIKLGFDAAGPGAFLLITGRVREAIALLEQDRARNPLDKGTSFLLVHAYGDAGNAAGAFAEAERGAALVSNEIPASLYRAPAMAQALGVRDKAQYERWRAISDVAGQFAAAPGPEAAAEISVFDRPVEALQQWQAAARDPSITALGLVSAALHLGYLGDTTGALDGLNRAYERGLPGESTATLWYPVMQTTRRLPAFKELVRKIGLVDYWREFGWSDYCKPAGGDDFECM